MQIGLAIAVALLIIAVVAWPLVFRPTRLPEDPEANESPSGRSLAAELNDVYDAIRALQTDHRLDRVSDADYHEQLDDYRRQAALILRAMELANDRPDRDD